MMDDEMNILPQGYSLGQLSILEVYAYYDEPIIFTCRNDRGTYYLAIVVEGQKDHDIWLYVPSQIRVLNSLRKNEIDIRDAVFAAEGDTVYKVALPFDPEENVPISTLSVSDIPMKWLPKPGVFLDYNSVVPPPWEKILEWKQISQYYGQNMLAPSNITPVNDRASRIAV